MPKQRIFNDATFDTIRALVAQNVAPDEIAARVGCKPSSLKVVCSQQKISLRRPEWKRLRSNALPKASPLVALPLPKPVIPVEKPVRQSLAMQSSITLSRVAQSLLRQRAERMGVTEAVLATTLLELIARDNLYDAVLDTKNVAA